jgi:hypothetical protein
MAKTLAPPALLAKQRQMQPANGKLRRRFAKAGALLWSLADQQLGAHFRALSPLSESERSFIRGYSARMTERRN